MIIDHLGRQFRNLRLSLTAACNYACTYCVPDGKRLLPAEHEMDGEQLIDLVKMLVEVAGVDKVRITGGEPLLSKKFDAVLLRVMDLGLQDVSLTTNGQLVPRKIGVLRESGIQRVNVSLDTLDAEYFRQIARSGDLETVLNGIELMLAAGIRLKINMVPMRGHNEDQILPLLKFCVARDIELRFIELMNMGHLRHSDAYRQQFFSMADVLKLIGDKYEFADIDAPYDSTAIRYQLKRGGVFGIIANESAPFCRTCTRLRLASNGLLYGCLSNSAAHDLRGLLQMSEPMALAKLQRILIESLANKQTVAFRGETTVMKFIGG